MNRDRCGGCGATSLENVINLGRTPLADRFPATADEPEPTYPLKLLVCTTCWLAQLSEIVPDEDLYGPDYAFYAGTSPSLRADNARLASELLKAHRGGLVVEVACNDGDLLGHFHRDSGWRAVGIDPAAGPVQMAQDRADVVYRAPFGREWAEIISDTHGKANLVIARNVAAHVADLDDFFDGLATLVSASGTILVECQYLVDLLAGCQFDHLYHEHRSFFSVTTLAGIASRHGLGVRTVRHVGAQGGSIRVELQRDATAGPDVGFWLQSEKLFGLHTLAPYRSFADRVFWVQDRINTMLIDLAHMELAGYAATAKSCTMLHLLQLDATTLPYIVDPAPSKVGRYTPGTKIPVIAQAPEGDQPDVYMLFAWNYLGGVLRRERAFMDGGGRFLVPLPMPVLL